MLFLILSSESMFVRTRFCDGMINFQKHGEPFPLEHNLNNEFYSCWTCIRVLWAQWAQVRSYTTWLQENASFS
jgi:hypothetical protein